MEEVVKAENLIGRVVPSNGMFGKGTHLGKGPVEPRESCVCSAVLRQPIALLCSFFCVLRVQRGAGMEIVPGI